jgi:D-alanine-D-alanine ligase
VRKRRIAIVYNQPVPSRYDAAGEEKAVLGVLSAVTAVHRSLREMGNDAIPVPLTPDKTIEEMLGPLDAALVFNLFEGFCGQPETEALVPEYLAEHGIPFTGCPAPVLRLVLDKARVKALLQAAGIPTPNFQVLNPQNLAMFQLRYPCIVKPHREDASHGISGQSVVGDSEALARQVRFISEAYGGAALVEEFVGGREFNATALGDPENTVLPISEIVYSLPPAMPRILTFAAKWEPGSPYFKGTKVVCPADISRSAEEGIAATVRATFRLTGCRGYARVDMRMDEAGRLNVIEVNPNPDISPDTGAARQAAAAGMTYTEFVERLVSLALEREEHDAKDPSAAAAGQARPDADTASYPRIQAV